MKLILSNESKLPIYEQIKEQIKTAIYSGELASAERLPSLRGLAKDLRISVLTVTRAYNDLEKEGLISSQQGKGYFVLRQDPKHIIEQFTYECEALIKEAVKNARAAGLRREEIYNILNTILEESHYD